MTSCFTGGVDSYFTLISNSSGIDALLYVHGFDVPLDDSDLRARTVEHLTAAALSANKRLIEVETNVRLVLDDYAGWGAIAHGPAIASIGHLLGQAAGTLLIPATHTYSDQYAWGSHPLTDPLWGSDTLSIVHDGAGVSRVEKTVKLADSDSARRHLRVCWQGAPRTYNCGRCEKCLRTKISLHLAGVLADLRP